MNNQSTPSAWSPTSINQAKSWSRIDDTEKLGSIAESEFADETIIREMALHEWAESARPERFLHRLLRNPNLTSSLNDWLDSESAQWSPSAQWSYWVERYGLDPNPSNFFHSFKPGDLNRGFTPEFTETNLVPERASRQLLEMSDQLAEQFWQELTEQGHIELKYLGDAISGDSFYPQLPGLDWLDISFGSLAMLDIVSPSFTCTWITKEEIFLSDDDDYDGSFQDYEVEIIADSPWEGQRFSQFDNEHQLKIAENIAATLQHPFLGAKHGLAEHFLSCIAIHDDTASDVRAFVIGLALESTKNCLKGSG